MAKRTCATYIGVIIGAIAWIFISSGFAMMLWNSIIVPVFEAPVLTYWQVFGIRWIITLMIPTRSTPEITNIIED